MFHFFYDYEEIAQSYYESYHQNLTGEYLETLDYIDLHMNIVGMKKGMFPQLMNLRIRGRDDYKQKQENKMSPEERRQYTANKLPLNIEYNVYKNNK